MNVASFVHRYIGLRVDFDGEDGAQCVDLVQVFAHDELHRSALAGNAVDLWVRPQAAGWRRTANAPWNMPPPGAIVVWGEAPRVGIGPLGHCGISVCCDPLTLITFDQNWPDGAACAIVVHSYAGVLGWLTPA